MEDRKTILVTGSLGQLGSELRRLSVQYPAYQFQYVDLKELDITDGTAIQAFFQSNLVHACINTAAYTAVDAAESNKELAKNINVEGVRNIARACANTHALFMHISTDFVFDGEKTTPYAEHDVPRPLNYYGLTKREGEYVAFDECPKTIIIRTAWLYSQFGKNFVKTILQKGKELGNLSIVSDQIGTPTYAKDLADALLQIIVQYDRADDAARSTLHGTYHYTNEGVASWYDFAQSIIEYGGISCVVLPIRTAQYPTPALRPAMSVLEKRKIRETFHLHIPHWRESLRDCIRLIYQ